MHLPKWIDYWFCDEFINDRKTIGYIERQLEKIGEAISQIQKLHNNIREKAGITTNAMAKMGKNENVSTEIICKICKVLECQVEDVIELVDEEEKEVC